jgi:uncharacterized protein (DUF427 family)
MADNSEASTAVTQPRVELVSRRVRAFFEGEAVVDSRRALLVWETRRVPLYYFPTEDVRMDLLQPSPPAAGGNLSRWDVAVAGRTASKAARAHPGDGRLGGHITFLWSKMDAWFEEDDEVFVHPRDPYHRVDVLTSSRLVRVSVQGHVIAETTRPRLLFETGLPTRYYIPKTDVRMDLLLSSPTVTACPYKGQARYWSVRAGVEVVKDLAWAYPAPIPECPKIENLVCFFNERVDLEVDGEPQPRPNSPWS